MKDLLKIEEIKIIGKYKVSVSYKFFNDIHKESKIVFNPRHKYALGSYPVILIDGTLIDIGPDQYWGFAIKKGKIGIDDKVNIFMLEATYHGWKIFVDERGRAYLKYEKKPNQLNWERDNKELRDFIVGVLTIAIERGIINFKSVDSPTNDAEIKSELWHLFKSVKGVRKNIPLEIRQNYTVEKLQVDFVILKQGKPFVAIECEPESSFDEGKKQAIEYAKKLKVNYYSVCTENKLFLYGVKSKKEFSLDKEGVKNFIDYLLSLDC
jgi:hypothetical protein